MSNRDSPSPFSNNHSECSRSRASPLEEHDYMGLADTFLSLHQKQEGSLRHSEAASNTAETDLRLGLGPPVSSSKNMVSGLDVEANLDACVRYGLKRGYAEAMSEFRAPRLGSASDKSGGMKNTLAQCGWVAPKTPAFSFRQVGLEYPAGSLATSAPAHVHPTLKGNQEAVMARSPPTLCTDARQHVDDNTSSKSQVVGWPPVRSFRKSTLTVPPKSGTEAEGVDNAADNAYGCMQGSQASLYVKVNMDAVPVGRKVDLRSYNSYEDLSHALIEMFQLPDSGQGKFQILPSRHSDPSDWSKPFHFHNDFSLTYEDKEGDWMLVGDVPWRIFLSAVCRLRIMRKLEVSRASEKSFCHK